MTNLFTNLSKNGSEPVNGSRMDRHYTENGPIHSRQLFAVLVMMWVKLVNFANLVMQIFKLTKLTKLTEQIFDESLKSLKSLMQIFVGKASCESTVMYRVKSRIPSCYLRSASVIASTRIRFASLICLCMLTIGIGNAWGTTYTKITSTAGLPSDGNSAKYLIVYESLNYVYDGSKTGSDLGASGDYKTSGVSTFSRSSSVITINGTDNFYFTISRSGDNYIIRSASGYYIGRTDNSNGLNQSTTDSYNHTITFSSNNAVITSSAGPRLQFLNNSGSYTFKYYKSDQQLVQLYKIDTATPTITTSVSSLSGVGYSAVDFSQQVKSFTVSGSNLTANVTVSAPTGFEVCKTSGGTYTSSVTFEKGSGTLSASTVYVRLQSGKSAGEYSGNITCASSGATNKNVALSGSVPFTVTWKANGTTHATTYVTYATGTGTALGSLPDDPDPDDYCGDAFYGWYDGDSYKNASVAPSIISTSTKITSDKTYKAVFADISGSSTTWVLTSLSSVTAGTYALMTGDYHAFSGSISSGKGGITTNAFSFTNGVATSAPTGTCEITFTAVTGGFKLYNSSTSKYLYAKGNTTGNLAWNDSESSYWKYNSSNWVYNSNSARLRSYNNGNFNTYNSNVDNSYAITLAKKTSVNTYSNYTTTCCTPLASINGSVSWTNPTEAVLTWNKMSNVADSDPYTISYRTGSAAYGTTNVGDVDLTGSKATCTITGLNCNTNYDFKIEVAADDGYCDKDTTMTGKNSGKWTITRSGSPAGTVTGGTFTTKISGSAVTGACSGDQIDIVATNANGYAFSSWTVGKEGGGSVTPNAATASTYFSMPADNVTVTAAFSCVQPSFTVHPASKTDYLTTESATALGYTASAAGASLTQQWQSSSDNSSWSNIVGATNSTYTPDISSEGTTYYRVIVTNSACSESRTSNVATITSVTPSVCKTPTFSVDEGTYNTSKSVSLSCATDGATIYYTTDNSTPTAESTEYTGAISVTQTTTIKAIAVADGLDPSLVASATYTIQCATPTFSVTAGTYVGSKSVEISTTYGTTIYYTTNGDNPTTGSTAYSSAITVGTSQTVKAIAVKTGCTNSAVGSAAYTIQCAAPTFSPAAGTYNANKTVYLSSTHGDNFYYTLDNSTPTTESTLYDSKTGISITASKTIKAIATKTGCDNSSASSATYTMKCATPTFDVTAGTYTGAQTVAISSTTPDVSIYYTTNGDNPTTGSTEYSSAITVSTNQTVKAIAVKDGWTNSDVGQAAYTIQYAVTWKVNDVALTGDDLGSASTLVTYNSKVTNLPPDPDDDVLNNCANKFMGWSKKDAGSTAKTTSYYDDLFTTAAGSTAITGATTFYAVFAEETATRDEGYYVKRAGAALTVGKTYVFGSVKASANTSLADNTTFGAVAFTNTYNSTSPNWGPRVDLTPNTSGYIAADNASLTDACKWTLISISSGNHTFKNGDNYLYLGSLLGNTTNGAQSGVSTSSGNCYLNSAHATCKDAYILYNTSAYTDKMMLYNTSYGYRMYAYTQTKSESMTPYVRFYEYDPGYTYSNYVTQCAANQVRVTYDFNGGTGTACTEGVTTKSASYTVCSTEPEKDYYDFAGWSDGTKTYDAGDTYSLQATTEFTATWTPTNYTITYNLNGGTQQVTPAAPTSYTVESSAVTLPTPTKSHDRFDGWYGNADLSTGGVQTTIAAGSNGNKVYYAKWTERHTIKFYKDDELLTTIYRASDENLEAAASGTLSGQGAKPSDPSAPSACSSKVFVGWTETWFNDETNTAPGDLSDATGKKTADKNYYAVWATRAGSPGSYTYSAYSTTCCGKSVEVDGGSPSNGTVTFDKSYAWTCKGDREIVMTITPAAGYQLHTFSVATGDGKVAAKSMSADVVLDNNSSAAQVITLTFAQDADGDYDVTATFTLMTVTSWAWTMNSAAIPDPLNLYVGQTARFDVAYTPAGVDNSKKTYTRNKDDKYINWSGAAQATYSTISGKASTGESTTEVTFTHADGPTKTINVKVLALPLVHFKDLIHGESFSDVVATLSDNALVATKKTPTHDDLDEPGEGNSCEKTHLHLIGWIRSDYSKVANYMNGTGAAPTTDELKTAGTGYWFEPDADINVETYNGKTFYAVWAVEE